MANDIGAYTADYFVLMWKQQKDTLDAQQKDEIGKSYLKHILGVDDKTIERFLDDDLDANHAIGMLQSGSGTRRRDYDCFWNRVAEIIPYDKEEMGWLAAHSQDDFAPYLLVCSINGLPQGDSHVINKIIINAHAYK